MKMGDEQITHWLVGPLPNLCDILTGEGWPVTGVDHENFSVTDNHGGIPARIAVIQVFVLDGVNAIRQSSNLSLACIAE
jgi:hypothetical protein